MIKKTIPVFILFINFLMFICFCDTHIVNPAYAAVSVLMQLEQMTGGRKYVMPGEKFTLSFKLVDGGQQSIVGITADLLFDNELLSVSTNTDVEIASDIKDKKTLYKNLIAPNKLRVLIIGFNQKVIPTGANLFTVRFKVIKRSVLLPGTTIQSHVSSSSSGGQNIATTGNSLFIPIFDTSTSLSNITGRVSYNQAGISGALVGLILESNPEIFYQTLSDAFGDYNIAGLIVGTYTIVALKDGYEAFMEKGLNFAQGNTLTRQISLTPGDIDFGFIYPVTSDEAAFLTSLSYLRVYGLAPSSVNSVFIKNKYLTDYCPGALIWTDQIGLSTGENIITALGNGTGQESDTIKITRTSETNFKINVPTDRETYETAQSSITVGGFTTADTSGIYLNGSAVSGYQAGSTSWQTPVALQTGVNYLNFTAKRPDGSLVGSDLITVQYSSNAQVEELTVTSPTSGNYYKTGQSPITFAGQTPAGTYSITMNDSPITGYIPGSTSWTAVSVPLIQGAAGNRFVFKAFDGGGGSLGEVSLTIEYEPGFSNDEEFKISLPSENDTYTSESQTITLGGITPATAMEIRVNGVAVSAYLPGETAWSTSFTLDSGQNHITVAAYDALDHEVGSDSIVITFILSFGGMKITQPVDSAQYETKKKSVHLGGQAPDDTYEIMVNEDLLSNYQAGQTGWSYDASINLGDNRFIFTSYDQDKNLIGRDEITVTNPGVLKITKPSASDNYAVEKKKIILGGTISWLPDDPVTSIIKINGQTVAGYAEGAPSWSYETDLNFPENDFYVLAYEASSSTVPIGFDFIKIMYPGIDILPDQPLFQITNPNPELVIVQEKTFLLEGCTPWATHKISRNGQTVSFTPAGTLWSDSVELNIGENNLRYEAFDESGRPIGQDGLLAVYTGGMKIVEPVTDTLFYTTEEDKVNITLQIDAAGTALLVNDHPLDGYAGESLVHYTSNLEEGENFFVFKLLNNEATKIGYSRLDVKKGGTDKPAIGSGFCFIRSIIPFSWNYLPYVNPFF